MNAETTYEQRVELLRANLRSLERVVIAYSGGVDSGVLLHVARAELGSNAFAVIADSPSLARSELEAALAFARSIAVEPSVLTTTELDHPRYRANAGNRCYFCRATLFDALHAWAREHGVGQLAFGEIVDDRLVERAGRAAARERGIHAPLADAGLSKDDVRRYAREHQLVIADKPASPCLASRIPVGTPVTRERLARIERAEEELRALGLEELRVRDHGERARIEVAASEFEFAQLSRDEIATRLAPLGFSAIELALYRAPRDRSTLEQRQ